METYSDIILEIHQKLSIESGEIAGFLDEGKNKGKYGLIIHNYKIENSHASEVFRKPIGKYTLLTIKNLIITSEKERIYYAKNLAQVIKNYLGEISNDDRILVVGLGNRYIIADSLGSMVVKNVIVTNHLKEEGYYTNCPHIFSFLPSVLGLTGMESSDIVESIVKRIKPTKILIVDSLCASSAERMGTSIQITDTGIVPGSGINNKRKELSKEVFNCEVFVIGVPLMIYAKTFLHSSLEKYNLTNVNLEEDKEDLVKSIDNIKKESFDDLVVTPSEINDVIKKLARIISKSINLALLGVDE